MAPGQLRTPQTKNALERQQLWRWQIETEQQRYTDADELNRSLRKYKDSLGIHIGWYHCTTARNSWCCCRCRHEYQYGSARRAFGCLVGSQSPSCCWSLFWGTRDWMTREVIKALPPQPVPDPVSCRINAKQTHEHSDPRMQRKSV